MASVNELLLAAQAQARPTPLSDLLETGLGGYERGLKINDARLDIATKLLAQEQARRKMEYQKQLAAEREAETMGAFNNVADPKKLAFPTEKLKRTIDADGNETREYTSIDRSDAGITPYQQELLNLKKQDIELRKSQADVKVKASEEKKQMRLAARKSQSDIVIGAVDDALKKVGITTAGLGSTAKNIPGSSAKDLDADLKTVKSNLGFSQLQAMREASPTGGALGQVAVQELDMLQSTIASLDQAQSPGQLTERLKKIKKHYQTWQSAVEQSGGSSDLDEAAPDDNSDLTSMSDEELERIANGEN